MPKTWGFCNIAFSFSFRSGKWPGSLWWQSAHSSPGQAGECKECKSNNRNGFKWICGLQINFSRRYASIRNQYGGYFAHLDFHMSSNDSYFDQYPDFHFSSDLSVSAFLGLSCVHRLTILTELLRCFPRLRYKGFLHQVAVGLVSLSDFLQLQ